MDREGDAGPEDREHRRREYSGAAGTLGLAALIVLAVGAGIWWFELRAPGGGNFRTEGFGVVELPAAANPTGQPAAARLGRAVPNFRLPTLDGGAVTLTDYRGKWIVLNFWASWCGPCRGETPDLQHLWERAGGPNLVVVGVNQQETPDAVRRFVDELQPAYPILLDRTGDVSEAFAVGSGLPVTMLIDPSGVLVRVYPGRITAGELEAIETDYLAALAGTGPLGRPAGPG
ncbi:MAG: TlpA family protein disulfide reductase [Dehalococcoidia bacterium]